ncbi:hypothetical protein GOP47_0024654 [Adiantum capillus-veneris]|uniref:Uncharacterized protein n=1 Tax=Adiantum capillus-veneris TaxID=13818 RepID=A0A9D4Z3V2_ADICA|nr:hypothetical protein GOP47_0024654 [Adiantum capillus-veneris]
MKPFFDQLCQKPDHKGQFHFSSPLLSFRPPCSQTAALHLALHTAMLLQMGSLYGTLWCHISEENKAGEEDLIVEADDSRLDDKVQSMEVGDPRTLDKENTLASKKKDSNEEAASLPANTSEGGREDVNAGSENGENGPDEELKNQVMKMVRFGRLENLMGSSAR